MKGLPHPYAVGPFLFVPQASLAWGGGVVIISWVGGKRNRGQAVTKCAARRVISLKA